MQLRIATNRLISEVQEDFNSTFPFLKLEFFKNKPAGTTDTEIPKIIPHHRRIADFQPDAGEGIIEINEKMKVRELETMLKDKYRLNAQVFRRSGNLWLQTTMTDGWTLENQNEHGMEISLSPKTPFINGSENGQRLYDQ